jgi:hypothetical protein
MPGVCNKSTTCALFRTECILITSNRFTHFFGGFMVTPATSSIRPIPVKMHSALMEWLLQAAQRFWENESRCLGFVLLYSHEQSTWSFELPPQNCTQRGSTWSLEDLPALPPGKIVVGSFQSRITASGSMSAVSLFPGVHFLHVVDPAQPILQVFLRLAATVEEPIPAEAADFVLDHASLVAWACENRLTLI